MSERTTAFNIFLEERSRYRVSKKECEKLWTAMNKRQKDRYRKIAKERNEGKAKTISIPAELQKSYMDRLIEELLTNKGRMAREVKEQVEHLFDIGKLDDHTFAILSIEHFFEDEHGIYPCELAIAKYSLKRGIFDTIAITINPGALPFGATNEAKLHSEETHQYPVPKDDEKEDEYVEIILKIIAFLKPEFDEIPMMFSEGGTIDNRSEQKLLINTRRAFQKILEKCNEYEIALDFQVYPLSYLFHRIQKCIHRGKNVPVGDVAEEHVNFKENQYYTWNTAGCEYHNIKDNQKNCCLSKVRRFGYSMAQFCSQPQKYQLIPGQHYPIDYFV